MNTLRGALGALSILALAAGLGSSGARAAAPADAAVTVHIVNFAFKPDHVNIPAGTTVTFVNDDNEPHTVTAVNKSFDSGGLDVHDSWKHTFTKAGTIAYFCQMHPNMKAWLLVSDGGKK